MIRLLRLSHAAAGYRLGAVRAQAGAARVLEQQAGRGPTKLPPSWGLATTQVTRAAHDLVRTRGGPSIKSAEVQIGTSQDIAQYDAVLERLASVESETLGRQELKDMVHSPALAAFQATHATAWLERYAALDDESLRPPKDGVRVLSAEGLLVMGRAVEILDGQRVTTSATRSRSKGSLKQLAGVEGFSPSLASRLLYALGHGGYTWRGKPLEELDRLVSLLLPVAVGGGGEGLRRLTAQELGRLPRGLASLYPCRRRMSVVPEPKFSEEMVHVEAECVRRGLDKFKAADLADLLKGLEGLRHNVNSALTDVVQERMMRRGYLTKGRGGHTDPRDAVRLLHAFSMTRPIRNPTARSSLSTFVSHVLASKRFLESLQPTDLLYAVELARRFDCHEIHTEVLERLIAREEEWAGREGVDYHTINRVFGSLNTAVPGTWPREGQDLVGRLVARWAAEVEAGKCVLHDPYDYFQRLSLCSIKGLLRGKGMKHAAQVLARGLADRLRLGAESWPTRPGHISEVLEIFHSLSYYPGHDIIGDLIDRFHAMSSIDLIIPGHLGNVTYQLLWAVEQHGYTPPPGFASMVLEWCKNTRLATFSDVSGLIVVVNRLYESFLAKAPPEAYPSQAAVDALLQHIGDPDKLVKRVCPQLARTTSPRLKAVVDRLKHNKAMATPTPPQGGDRGAEDGHKKAEQPEGKGADGGGKHDEARMKTLWKRVRDAQMGQRAGQALDQPSPVTHALSTAELSMLLEEMACGGVETAVKGRYRAGAVCLRAMVREGVRPGRLEAMDKSTLRAWVRCLGRVGILLDVQERRAMMDAWEEEVKRRGLLQVATKPEELADVMWSLRQVEVEVEEGLVLSLLEGIERMGLQSFTPAQMRRIFPIIYRMRGWGKQYREHIVTAVRASPPQDLDRTRLLTVLWGTDISYFLQNGTYVEQLMSALEAKGVYELPLQQLVVGVSGGGHVSAMPFQPLLRALERAVAHGHPDGILAPLPEDEGEREALREQALQGLTILELVTILKRFGLMEGQCDFDVQERVLRAYLSAVEQGLSISSDSHRPLKEASGGRGVVTRPPSRGGHVGSSRADAVQELMDHWWALVQGTQDNMSGPSDISLERLEGLESIFPFVVSLASRAGLSHGQMAEACAPLMDDLEATLARGAKRKKRCYDKNPHMHRAVLLLCCLEHAGVVPRRRETMVLLWEWAVASGFRHFRTTGYVALLRGAVAHDLHPGSQALERSVVHCTNQSMEPRVAAAAVEMEQSGGKGGGGGAEGRRFLRRLRDRLQGGKEA